MSSFSTCTLIVPPAAIAASARSAFAASEAAPPASLTEVGVFYERVTRAVRRSIHLVQHLQQPLPVQRDQRRALARRQIIRSVEDYIERQADGPEVENLHAELLERIDAPDLDDEIDTRPLAEIIDDIRRDLGLDRFAFAPFKRRTPADIATLCARAAGSAASAAPQLLVPSDRAVPVRSIRGVPHRAPSGPAAEGRLTEDDALLLHRAMRYREP